MRSLALAQAWRRMGGGAVFAACELPEALESRVTRAGFEVRHLNATRGSDADSALTAGLAVERGVTWVLCDGYAFGPAYQSALQRSGRRVLLIDDYGHDGRYEADIIVNQNIGARSEWYVQRPARSRLLLDTRYALLREEFASHRGSTRSQPEAARRILVTMGGADPDNVTTLVLNALAGLDLEIRAVVGAANPHLPEIRAAAAQTGAEVCVQVDDMPALMAWADVAVTAGGSTCWELCLLGVPMVVVNIAENQRALVRNLGRAGAAVDAGNATTLTAALLRASIEPLLSDSTRKASLSAAARQCVDGWGGERVCTAMRGDDFFLRPACTSDARQLWEWANDPAVRAASFDSREIAWDSHQAWFARRLAEPATRIYLAETPELPAGVVRFQRSAEGTVISIALSPSLRGRGLGARLIAAATRKFSHETRAEMVHAYIRPGNDASIRAFLRAGYVQASDTIIGHQPALHAVWNGTSGSDSNV